MESEKSEEHHVPSLTSPIRLQEYGVGIFNHIPTKSALKKALKKQFITIDDLIATTATMIKGGEIIRLTIPTHSSPNKQLVFPLKVLYEDEYLAVIHKPAGILVSGNSFKTIANALTQNLSPSTQADATVSQPVHRLDYATTGLLLVGKTSSSIRELNKMFEEKKIDKTYYAVTIGKMDEQGSITSKIDGKAAQTKYEVKASVNSERFGKLNLVELQLGTGRKHQIRKHLSSLGNPILGDKDYGIDGLVLMKKGMYLHAFSLGFTHPFTKARMYFKDELPNKFNKIFPK